MVTSLTWLHMLYMYKQQCRGFYYCSNSAICYPARSVFWEHHLVCLFVCFQNALVCLGTPSNAALILSSPEMKPVLVAVGSATVAVLSQSSGIERPFFAMRRGHVVYNNCALYI